MYMHTLIIRHALTPLYLCVCACVRVCMCACVHVYMCASVVPCVISLPHMHSSGFLHNIHTNRFSAPNVYPIVSECHSEWQLPPRTLLRPVFSRYLRTFTHTHIYTHSLSHTCTHSLSHTNENITQSVWLCFLSFK